MVEYAKPLFRSFWPRANVAPGKVVTPPTQEVVYIVGGNIEMKLKIRAMKKIPAATIVAA